jgi:hypothetical protein
VNIEEGVSGRGRKRDREKWINGERETEHWRVFGKGADYKNDHLGLNA